VQPDRIAVPDRIAGPVRTAGPDRLSSLLTCAAGLDLASAAGLDQDQAREFDRWPREMRGPITRLVTPDQFAAMTRWAVGHGSRTGAVVAVIVAGLSGFSPETSPDGRPAEWLVRAAGRMLTEAGPSAAAQISPGEFAFLRHDLRDPGQASEIAGRIRGAARYRPAGDGGPESRAVTVGVAVALQHDTAETLISAARLASRRRQNRLHQGLGQLPRSGPPGSGRARSGPPGSGRAESARSGMLSSPVATA
jgi:GGDEF domain-containing protein